MTEQGASARSQEAARIAGLLDKADIPEAAVELSRSVLWDDVDGWKKLLMEVNKKESKGTGVDLYLTPLIDEDGKVNNILVSLKQAEGGVITSTNIADIGNLTRKNGRDKSDLTEMPFVGVVYKEPSNARENDPLSCVTAWIKNRKQNQSALPPFR